jgi:arsenate reductase
MAEGLLRHLGGRRFDVYSAGVNPTPINPLAIKVMSEIGIDISHHRSKSAMEFIGQQFDYVITVCDKAKQTCPAFTGKHEKIHWSLEDPAGAGSSEDEKVAVFRKTRDQIKDNIIQFLKGGFL